MMPTTDAAEHLLSEAMNVFNRVEPFEASDEFIRQSVEQADLPSLMVTLAMLTGDTSLIGPDVKPPVTPMRVEIAPQGGMSKEMQDKARSLATAALIAFRDSGQRGDVTPSEALLTQCMQYLLPNDIDELRPLLAHEMGFTKDPGAPDWTRESVAPGVKFRVAVIGGQGLQIVVEEVRQRIADLQRLEAELQRLAGCSESSVRECRIIETLTGVRRP